MQDPTALNTQIEVVFALNEACKCPIFPEHLALLCLLTLHYGRLVRHTVDHCGVIVQRRLAESIGTRGFGWVWDSGFACLEAYAPVCMQL